MKKHVLLLLLGLWNLPILAQKPNTIITRVEPGDYQLSYPNQKIIISFKHSEIPKSSNYFLPVHLNEEEQHNVLKKEEDNAGPEQFIKKKTKKKKGQARKILNINDFKIDNTLMIGKDQV